jgi:hypothetical protein
MESKMTSSAPPTPPQRTACAGAWTPCREGGPSGAVALRASLPDEHPVATLLDEHQVILSHLARLAELTAASTLPEPRADLEELAQLASRLIGAEPHHRREEEVLFPALQERGIHGPPEAMAFEHVGLRALKHELHEGAGRLLAGDPGAWPDVRITAATLIETLRAHIAKEDNVLYPLALRVIRDAAVWAELRRRCDAIGYCCGRVASRADELH